MTYGPIQFGSAALCDPVNPNMPRPPCPTPTHGVYSNSCPSSWWCHPAISSSVTPSPPAPKPSYHQGVFQWVNSSHEVAKVLEFQLQHQSCQWTPRTDLWDGLVGSPCSPRNSQESSPTPQFKSINFSVLNFLHYFMANRKGKTWKQWQVSSSWALKLLQMVTATMKSEDYFLAGKLWQR